ncbi:unnamed protein product [Thelazia callipaeda]|uniref:DNA repair endonuclease XPF n=1 Tax=Thelazia callipaeda TaxID=103827 RepID=A0A0N5CZH8_THECL|nr:unnamed protein product [Thelazia callipaeda]
MEKVKQETVDSTYELGTTSLLPGENSGDMIELLPFERNLMLDTYADDVLFIVASGLGLERLILHHLHLYSDPQLLVFVINTTPQDDEYFLCHLRNSKIKCPPKIITADCSTKDRESLYMEGGIQFITSRILMVDLLQERVPVKNVAGIIVHRAHQLLNGFQESFILRLYREKKENGFIKAFSDNPGAVIGLGVLQRLLNRLYVRRIRLLPRFDVDVKHSLDTCSPKMVEISINMPHPMRKVQCLLVDIIRTCVRELKQSSSSDISSEEEEMIQPVLDIYPSTLERQLASQQFSISEKQQRLLADLKQLRGLLYRAEELDPITLHCSLNEIKNDKDLLTNNSGWMFTQTSARLVAEVDGLCKIKSDSGQTVLEPPKWKALLDILNEIKKNNNQNELSNKKQTVLLIGAGNEVCLQLRDIITDGVKKFLWVKNQRLGEEFISSTDEPQAEPSWDPSQVILFNKNVEDETRGETLSSVKVQQKEIVRKNRKRRRLFDEMKKKESSSKQTRLMRFGIVQIKKSVEESESAHNNDSSVENTHSDPSRDSETCILEKQDPLLIIVSSNDRYNLMKQLEIFDPRIVILYHSDLFSLRLLEMYKACYSDKSLTIYIVMYANSNEEERYLLSLRKEQIAFEEMVREHGTLMFAREYETERDEPRQLKLAKSTRDAGGRISEEEEENPKVIVDMREFNSQLPTVLYKRGIDLIPATIEVGDYILSPNIAVERKALDDLTQSLHSGRIFKQIEQMLRHYKCVVLLIEANVKVDCRKINGGPFQGELSRRCRETRSIFTILVRTYPKMNIIWTLDPLNEPNPDLTQTLAIKSDLEESTNTSDSTSGDKVIQKRVNSVLHRQLTRLPGMSSGEVTRLMKCEKIKCLLDVVNASVNKLEEILTNTEQASSLHHFFSTDFKLKALLS